MRVDPDKVEQWLNFLMAKAVNDALTLGLSDDLGGEVIHIDSSIPRHLNLSITNTLTVEVEIVGQAVASPSNYHFHIQFVDNQCFSHAPTLTTPNWDIAHTRNNAGLITDIYLLSKDNIVLSSASAPNNTTSVRLRYQDAKLDHGVEILQVAVTVGQYVYAKLKPNPEPVTGTETLHLSTFTDAGAPSPLIATLVQPKTILNDDTTADLLLHLVNTSPDPMPFIPPSEAGSPTPTAIQLTVDVDDAAAWALCKAAEADSIVIHPPLNWSEVASPKTGTGQKTWLFRPDYGYTKQIDAHSVLPFSLHCVKTTLPPGFTNLYVTLEEFPNYGTQTVVTQIEKSPLIYNKGINSGLLSQGTTGASQALTLNGNTTGDLLLVEQSGAGSSAHFKGGAGVTIENNLVVSGDMRMNDRTLWFRRDSDKNHGIGWYGTDKLFANTNVDGPVTFGLEGGALGSTDGGERIALAWKKTGNVGVGSNNPQSALSVKGGVAVGSSYADTHAAPADTLIVEGTVGIGTNQPESQFHVRSNNGIRLGLEGSGGGQLFIGGANDKSVQLVAIDSSEKSKAASKLYLGGPYDATLPNLTLNAKEVNIQATDTVAIEAAEKVGITSKQTTVTGVVNTDSLIVNGELDVYGRGLYVEGKVHIGGNDEAGFYLRRNATTYLKLGFNEVGPRLDWAIWTSDGRLKQDRGPIQDALSKVLRLRGLTFGWNEEGLQKFTGGINEGVSAGPKATEEQNENARNQERQRVREELAGDHLGLVAQEVEKVLPEVVEQDQDGYKQIRYMELVPLLVEAIKEQSAQIEALSNKLAALTENA